MASSCCSLEVSPGLLGQLIFATVATHAARNSLSVCGIEADVSFFVECLEEEQAHKNNSDDRNTNEKDFDMQLVFGEMSV